MFHRTSMLERSKIGTDPSFGPWPLSRRKSRLIETLCRWSKSSGAVCLGISEPYQAGFALLLETDPVPTAYDRLYATLAWRWLTRRSVKPRSRPLMVAKSALRYEVNPPGFE